MGNRAKANRWDGRWWNCPGSSSAAISRGLLSPVLYRAGADPSTVQTVIELKPLLSGSEVPFELVPWGWVSDVGQLAERRAEQVAGTEALLVSFFVTAI